MNLKALFAVLLIAVCFCSCKGAGAYGSDVKSEAVITSSATDKAQDENEHKNDNSAAEKEIFDIETRDNPPGTETAETIIASQTEGKMPEKENSGRKTESTAASELPDNSSEQESSEKYDDTGGYGSIIP